MRPASTLIAVLLTTLAPLVPVAVAGQVGGNLAALPAVELTLRITTEDAGPRLSRTDFELVTGEYYRLTVESDGGRDWRFEADDLLQNSHLRLVTISGIEVHLQGMVFRAIELDQEGAAAFSFTPVRPGTYEFTVGSVPSAVGRPIGTAGARDQDRPAVGRFVVR